MEPSAEYENYSLSKELGEIELCALRKAFQGINEAKQGYEDV